MEFKEKDLLSYLEKWQEILRLQDWDIRLEVVNQKWRKTGDVKVDRDDKKAILLVNVFNPTSENTEETIIHELLHIKLWDMDQMLEGFLHSLFGKDPEDPRYNFALQQFMILLESTVEDLTKGFLQLGGEEKELSFGRVEGLVKKELGSEKRIQDNK